LARWFGSFLNVVIHRLPIMLERQWREQADEALAAGEENSGPIAIAETDLAGAETAAFDPTATTLTNIAAAAATYAAEANVANIDRPEPYNLITPRSRCPQCNAAIKAHQNIPV
jgi:leader peptidase (prepilin peptidase)/N-methyltransferase